MFYPMLFVGAEAPPNSLRLRGCPILVDAADYAGIHLAARALSGDFAKVTSSRPNALITSQAELAAEPRAIVIGSIERSTTIRALVEQGKLDISPIQGKWETFQTTVLANAVPGCEKVLVIAGSDKRGAIFGAYTMSEQIGVSPWYFWSDVPAHHHDEIYALDVKTLVGPPDVKYRGLFINDEAPALAGWVHEKYGSVFNCEFYEKVFELLLRLKANYLWPAMWFGYPHPGQSFFVDDPRNQQMADAYGIVVSTSHHEPMQRASNEWFSTPYHEADGTWSWATNKEKIVKFFEEGVERAKPYESYVTMGMRGEGDRKIAGNDPQKTLSEVLEVQRAIIDKTFGSGDRPGQVMALYKEVQKQYSAGLQIPEDITLLFSDDNYGSVRRLPYGNELSRSGGAGLYYHFEYVGHPRSYMWTNSNHLAKVHQQLDQAYQNGVDRIWIFNVGDVKPMELPLTFGLKLAWSASSMSSGDLSEYFATFAASTFDLDPGFTRECAQLYHDYDRLLALRKHDHIEADTFSLLNYDEADIIEKDWTDLLVKAEALQARVPSAMRPAFYELVLHPVKASSIFISLRVAQARNRLFALQRRNSANFWAGEVLRLFDADFDLSQEYHQLLDGKWNHIVRQPHLGYREIDFAPSRDMIDGVSYVQTRQDPNPISGFLGLAVEGHGGVRPGLTCEEADRTHPSRRDLVPGVTLPPLDTYGPRIRWFQLFSKCTRPLTWTIVSPYEWLRVSRSSGHLGPRDPDVRVEVSVDWTLVPSAFREDVLIEIRSSIGDFEYVHVPVIQHSTPAAFSGFIESDKNVSIHATHFDPSRSDVGSYQTLPFLGRTGDGAVARKTHLDQEAGFLSYPFYTFTQVESVELSLYFTFTLDTNPDRPLTYGLSMDDKQTSTYRLMSSPVEAGDLAPEWMDKVMNCVWKRGHAMVLTDTGAHVLKVRLNDANCVLEKIVIDLGGVRKSYLGPPESKRQQTQ